MTAAIAELPKEKAKTAPPAKPETAPPLDHNSASQNIPVNMIVRSPFNRKAEVSDEFVSNIRQNGVLQPVIVRPVKLGLTRLNEISGGVAVGIGDMVYELVAGERRWLASKKANWPSIPAIIRELTDVQAMKIQLAENDQREDYNILDRAEAYARLRNEYMQQHKGEKGFTEEKCMDLIAADCKNDKIKGRTVQQIIALHGKLSQDCKAALRKGEMEQSHAYEFSRLSVQDQAELLLWLRQQTHHSQGDIPSVRRLKLEIRNMEQQREAEKRQPLFQETEKKESGAGAKLTFDGKTIELAPGQLPGSVRTPLLRIYPELSTAYFLKDGRVQLANGLTGTPFYMSVAELQKLLSAKALHAPVAPAQTLAPVKGHGIDNRQPAPAQKMTAARLKEAELEKKRIEGNRAREEKKTHSAEVERQARILTLDAIAKKAKLDRSLIDLVAIDLLKKSDDDVSQFAVRTFKGWPQPGRGKTFSWSEIDKIGTARVPKLKPNQLAGLLIAALLSEDMFVYAGNIRDCKGLEAMARKYKVNMAKIRKDVTAEAKLKAKGQKPKAGVSA